MIQRIKDVVANCLSTVIPFRLLRIALPDKFIVYGHLVSNSIHIASEYYRYPNVKEFDEFIREFKRLGYRFVSLPDYLLNNQEKKIHLTFDDGFKILFDELHPYMTENNIPYTLFILSDPFWSRDFSIKKSVNKTTSERLFLSIEEIEKLKDQNVHIGFHTRSHMKIESYHSLSDNAVIEQLTIPKEYEYLLSQPKCFAYPFMAPSNFVHFNEFMVNLGYSFFFDTKGFLENQRNHFFRVSIDIERTVHRKSWIRFVMKRQLLPRAVRQLMRF